jgi:hypothetical protein
MQISTRMGTGTEVDVWFIRLTHRSATPVHNYLDHRLDGQE